jgi:TonB family protein
MTSDPFNGALNLLGQSSPPAVSTPPTPAEPTSSDQPARPSPSRIALSGPEGLQPKLEISWGAFHQGIGSSVRALCTRTGLATSVPGEAFFKDSRIERRIPRRALVAAALWHVAFVVLPPFPGLSMTPRHNPALDNVQLAWSGPIDDLPLVNIPKQRTKPAHAAPNKVEPQPGADAFHPRQRIFTDPVRPNHLRQTLINPTAPFEPPKVLPDLPNMVQLQAAVPPRPRLFISEETLKKLRPKQRRIKTVTTAPPLDAPNMELQVTADLSLPSVQSGPARPKLEMNAGAAPRVASRAQAGDAGPAPDVGANVPNAAGGSPSTLIALSATPGPPAPVVVPEGNLAARVAISPEGKIAGGSESSGGEGKSPVGVSISGGNPTAKSGVSGLGGKAPKIAAPSVRALMTRPQPQVTEDEPERVGPPDFKTLPPGAKPEAIFASKRVYTMNVNMPNISSATGSWILNFSELHSNPYGPHITSTNLSGPVVIKKVDPKYPPTLVADRVEGEVVLYAVIRRDGSVDGIQLVRSVDDQLDANAMSALAQWKFRPASKQGEAVELEALVHIPFHIPQPE